jgi:hypothetical protein
MGLPLRTSLGANNEPVRRRSNKIERVTGDECERLNRARIEDVHVGRRDDASGHDTIPVLAAYRCEQDDVILLDVFQRAKEGITVTGEPDVSRSTGQTRTEDMPDRVAKSGLVGPFDDGYREAKPEDLDAADDVTRIG